MLHWMCIHVSCVIDHKYASICVSSIDETACWFEVEICEAARQHLLRAWVSNKSLV